MKLWARGFAAVARLWLADGGACESRRYDLSTSHRAGLELMTMGTTNLIRWSATVALAVGLFAAAPAAAAPHEASDEAGREDAPRADETARARAPTLDGPPDEHPCRPSCFG